MQRILQMQGQEFQLMFASNIRLKKKYNVCDFNHCVIVGTKTGWLEFFEISWEFHTQQSTVYNTLVYKKLNKNKKTLNE